MGYSHDDVVTCTNPDCGEQTVVHTYGSTLTDPSYPDRDLCECGAALDWDSAEPYDEEWDRDPAGSI